MQIFSFICNFFVWQIFCRLFWFLGLISWLLLCQNTPQILYIRRCEILDPRTLLRQEYNRADQGEIEGISEIGYTLSQKYPESSQKNPSLRTVGTDFTVQYICTLYRNRNWLLCQINCKVQPCENMPDSASTVNRLGFYAKFKICLAQCESIPNIHTVCM